MKLITFTEAGRSRVGLLKDDGVIDLSSRARACRTRC